MCFAALGLINRGQSAGKEFCVGFRQLATSATGFDLARLAAVGVKVKVSGKPVGGHVAKVDHGFKHLELALSHNHAVILDGYFKNSSSTSRLVEFELKHQKIDGVSTSPSGKIQTSQKSAPLTQKNFVSDRGGGHFVAVLGRTSAGELLVADPAGDSASASVFSITPAELYHVFSDYPGRDSVVQTGGVKERYRDVPFLSLAP